MNWTRPKSIYVSYYRLNAQDLRLVILKLCRCSTLLCTHWQGFIKITVPAHKLASWRFYKFAAKENVFHFPCSVLLINSTKKKDNHLIFKLTSAFYGWASFNRNTRHPNVYSLKTYLKTRWRKGRGSWRRRRRKRTRCCTACCQGQWIGLQGDNMSLWKTRPKRSPTRFLSKL
jgi:hypothetical protein